MPAEESTKESTDSTVETLNTVNLKTVGESAAFYTSLAMKDAVSHARRSEILAENFMGVAVKNMHELDASQALALVKANTGNDLASQIAGLVAALSASQQGVKAAQTTPPVTP